MNREEIDALWRECCIPEGGTDELVYDFAQRIAAAEREACAQTCDVEASNRHIDRINLPWDEKELRDVFRIQAQQASDCAKAIRARGQA
ncbi:MAG: hypothetical protein ACR2IJ_05890 [Fluviibacter sp.]